ncbi:MAG: NAD(P)H-hydrate dehydratase [Gemmatimonadaceae bacterium]|nr:NAD(P)H-hydrate dehydratase [Gemmatimonadaceae bacterium]
MATAAEAAAIDQATIASGVDSFALMCRAGTEVAAHILGHHADRFSQGVCLCAGVGNNGGDAYIVAAQLYRAGVRVRLRVVAPPRTSDAQRAAALWENTCSTWATCVDTIDTPINERLIVDGVLGTGHRGELRTESAVLCGVITQAHANGAYVVALDIPSGVDATSGDVSDGAVIADETLTFGTIKRGLLLQRAHAGRMVLIDIGVGEQMSQVHVEQTMPAWWHPPSGLRSSVPHIAWNAHKGRRGRVAVAGGDTGMAGAVVLACRAALTAGGGVVHAIVDEPSVAAVQALVPQVIARGWPPLATSHKVDALRLTPSESGQAPRYDALAIGPGLGRSRLSSHVLQRLVDSYRQGPLVLDADALWLAAEAATALGTDTASLLRYWLRDTPHAVLTPHPGEFARMTGEPLPATWDARVARVHELAQRTSAVVLLKGTPTVVAVPLEAGVHVVPHGTPVLATGGSGDCLTGIIAALLAQGATGASAAIVGATVHGVAAELVSGESGGPYVAGPAGPAGPAGYRGHLLDAVLEAMPEAWERIADASGAPYVDSVGCATALPFVR